MGLRRKLAIATAVTAVLAGTGFGTVLHEHTYDLREERVAIGTLDAVLARPTSDGHPTGLVIFVHGDGPIDATHDGFYRPIWESLAQAGYASLSWNKPGVAGSPGNWLHQSMDNRAREVIEAITWARSRPYVGGHRIGLWGASQAGWVMPKVAAETPDLAFVVAVSPAINWLRQGRYNLLAELRAQDASPATIAERVERSEAMQRLLRQDASYEEYRRQPGANPGITADRWTFIAKNYQADATADLARIRAPVLLLLAGHDINVDVAETESVYRRTVPTLQVGHYPEASHSMLHTSVEDSIVRLTIQALFAPRSVFTDGFLLDQRRFLESLPAAT